MSVYYMSIIALAAGVFGGIINYFLPSNNPVPPAGTKQSKPVDPLFKCIFLGIGATLLVPLFLELAKSKLLDNLTYRNVSAADTTSATIRSLHITSYLDSLKKVVKTDTVSSKVNKIGITTKRQLPMGTVITSDTVLTVVKPSPKAVGVNEAEVAKNYFLWLSYCVIAASAGLKFINMLTSKVVTTTEVSALRTALSSKEEKEKLMMKQNARNQKAAEEHAFKVLEGDVSGIESADLALKSFQPIRQFIVPTLVPGKFADDIQKGRFGGLAEKNDKMLSAVIRSTSDPEFFEINISVATTDGTPLQSDVLIYLDGSFNPSVVTISKAEIDANGGVATYSVETWHAFTIGAITDFGDTLLELDLADPKVDAPKRFKGR